MNTCDTCKWWCRDKRDPIDASIFRGCLNPKLNSPEDAGDDLARPDACDDYGIGFYTGPKFGCIHHEVKP